MTEKRQGLLSRLYDWWNSRRLNPVVDLWSGEPSYGEWKLLR